MHVSSQNEILILFSIFFPSSRTGKSYNSVRNFRQLKVKQDLKVLRAYKTNSFTKLTIVGGGEHLKFGGNLNTYKYGLFRGKLA